MSSPYSTRFIAGQVPSGSLLSYTVPPLKRAVIRSLDAGNPFGSQATVTLRINGIAGFVAVLAATTGSVHWDGRQVVYAGETFDVYTIAGTALYLVSGYLFADP